MGASHKFGSLVADGDTGAAAAELAAQQQQQQAQQQQEAESASSFKSQQKAHSRASKDSLLGRQSKDSMLHGDGAAPPTTARASMHIGDSTMDEKELQEAVRARPHVSRTHTEEPSHHSYQHLHNAIPPRSL